MQQCAAGVFWIRTLVVNVYFVADEAGSWTLIDAGLAGYRGAIRRAAAMLFGTRRPASIVLTHGHFDHVGALPALAEEWSVPVYVHPLELPYVTGRSSYPPPDPTVGGGGMAALSPLYSRGPIDLGPHAVLLPPAGEIPGLPGWRWIHTPGHTPGHVALFREADRTLIAGDAFVTTRQESVIDVMKQREVVWRPPAYYTTDWTAARQSVVTLAALEPLTAATGHGRPLSGPALRTGLQRLADRFDAFVPAHGRYVAQPAIADEQGVARVPPPIGSRLPMQGGVAAAALMLAGVGLLASRRAGFWR